MNAQNCKNETTNSSYLGLIGYMNYENISLRFYLLQAAEKPRGHLWGPLIPPRGEIKTRRYTTRNTFQIVDLLLFFP